MKINFDDLLTPISIEQPAGQNIEYEQIYDDIRQARESDPDYLPQGAWATELRKADWSKVVRLSHRVLKEDSKDLQVACWLVEGLTQQHGLSGLKQGCEFLMAFIQRYWDHCWPELDEDGAVIRHSLFNCLDRKLMQSLNVYQLMDAPESTLAHWQKVLIHEHQSTGKTGCEQAGIDVDCSMEAFNRWAAGLDTQKIAAQSELLTQLVVLLDALENCYTDLNPHADSYSMGQTRGVIEEMQEFVKRLFDRAAPAYDDVMTLPHEEIQSVEDESFASCTQKQRMSRDLAISQMLAIAHFFRQSEPSSPVPFLMERAARWANMTLTEWLEEMLEDESSMRDINKILKGQE